MTGSIFPEYLRQRLPQLQSQAWADSTMRTRRSQWKKYMDFCSLIERVPIPVDVDVIPIFLLHLALKGLSYTTINNEVSAIVTLGKLNGCGVDIRGNFAVQVTLVALKRILGDSACPRDELLPSDLRSIYPYVDQEDFTHWSTWVGLVFLYRTMLRKGHLFPGDFNHNLLSRQDIQFTEFGMVVCITKSKTIQFKERTVEIPVCTGGNLLCAVSLIKDFFQRFPTSSRAPILSWTHDSKLLVVPYTKALKLFQHWGKLAGLKKTIGMHSLRRGSATLMSLGGIPIQDIQNRGDWKSLSVLHYLSYPMQQKVSIEQKIVNLLVKY